MNRIKLKIFNENLCVSFLYSTIDPFLHSHVPSAATNACNVIKLPQHIYAKCSNDPNEYRPRIHGHMSSLAAPCKLLGIIAFINQKRLNSAHWPVQRPFITIIQQFLWIIYVGRNRRKRTASCDDNKIIEIIIECRKAQTMNMKECLSGEGNNDTNCRVTIIKIRRDGLLFCKVPWKCVLSSKVNLRKPLKEGKKKVSSRMKMVITISVVVLFHTQKMNKEIWRFIGAQFETKLN